VSGLQRLQPVDAGIGRANSHLVYQLQNLPLRLHCLQGGETDWRVGKTLKGKEPDRPVAGIVKNAESSSPKEQQSVIISIISEMVAKTQSIIVN